jgi:alanine racemase
MSINAWSEKLPYRAFVSLSAQALCANYREIRRYAAGKKIIAVVKADAYGHGAVPVAMILEREGADRFAVATLDEAKVLREAGITRPILVLGPSDPAAVKMMAQLQVGVTVADFAYGQKLAAAATAAKVTICVHIKIDTGMTRLGFLTDGTSLPETLEQIKALFSTGSLIPEGLYSHYASSDSDRQMTAAQRSCFFVVRDALLEICDFPVIHLENSGALCHD